MQETQVWSLGWKDPWRKWQPTSVFLPGQFHGQRSLAVCSPWGLKELNTTEQLSMHSHTYSCSPKDLVSMWPVAILYYPPSQLGFRKESSWEFLWRLSLALRNRGLFLVLGYQLYLTVFSPERETGVPVRDNLPTYFKNIKWCSTSCSSNRGLTKKNRTSSRSTSIST